MRMRPIEYPCRRCAARPNEPCLELRTNKFHAERYKDAHMSPGSGMLRSARKASLSPIPYASERVTFIWNAGRSGSIHMRFAITTHEKRELLKDPRRHVYCVWPGETRTDLFVIDDVEAARVALG